MSEVPLYVSFIIPVQILKIVREARGEKSKVVWFCAGDDFRKGDRLRAGRGTTRAKDAQGTPTQSHISTSILVYEDHPKAVVRDSSSSSLLLSSLELSDTQVYEP